MPLRVTASGDPTATASAPSPSSSSAKPSIAPASTSAANCSVASQASRSARDEPLQSSSSSSGKRARLQGPDLVGGLPDYDVDMRSPDERKADIDASRPPPPPVVYRSPSAGPAAPSSLSSSSSSAPSLPQMSTNVPVWASLKALRAAGLDPRVLTSLVVDLDVDKRACPAPIVLKRVYSSDPTSKLSAVASLLGDPKAGFAIIPPALPRALLSADADARASSWSGPQQAWYQELVSQARDSGQLVREAGSTPAQRGAALTALFNLIDADKLRQLWPQQEFTSSWADLLFLPSAILHDRARDVQQTVGNGKAPLLVPEYTYRVRLCCATAEVTYIVACCIANYALLPREAPEAAKRLRAILGGARLRSHESSDAETSASEPDSSDSDGEWHTYRSSREAARQRKRAASRTKLLAAFTTKELSAERFKADSGKPLLQLATRVTMRSWQHHFVECFVSNWQSVGCRDHFGQDDPAFHRVAAAVPELQDVTAVRWQLHDQVGGTLVSLFVRDDLCAQLPKLNAVLRQLPGLQHAALKVTCDAHPRRARGERAAFGDRRRYCLTPDDAPSLSRVAPSGTSSSMRLQGTTALPSWAAVLSAARPVSLPAARRPGPATPIDHRPRKDPRRESPAALPPSSAPTGNKPVDQATKPSSAPWEARIAAMEARLNGIQALCDSLRDVPRLLASIQRKLDQQLSVPPPSLISSPPHSADAPAPAALHVPCDSFAPSTAVAELFQRADAHESLLDRICGQLNQLMQGLRSQTETARHGGMLIASDVPSAGAQHSAQDLPARPSAVRQ